MMLLDADILIDVALDRHPHADAAAEILDRLEQEQKKAFVAWHTLANLFYLVTPQRGGIDTRDFIEHLTRFVVVAPTGTDAIQYASDLPIADFEDAMQVAAAHACGARHIITRNTKDYKRSPIPALTPRDALDALF